MRRMLAAGSSAREDALRSPALGCKVCATEPPSPPPASKRRWRPLRRNAPGPICRPRRRRPLQSASDPQNVRCLGGVDLTEVARGYVPEGESAPAPQIEAVRSLTRFHERLLAEELTAKTGG